MQFHISWTISAENRNAAEARFKETGALPPEGVKLVSRYHDVGRRRGFMIVESDDAGAVAAYLRQWTDLLTFETTPVISDEELTRVIG